MFSPAMSNEEVKRVERKGFTALVSSLVFAGVVGFIDTQSMAILAFGGLMAFVLTVLLTPRPFVKSGAHDKAFKTSKRRAAFFHRHGEKATSAPVLFGALIALFAVMAIVSMMV